ncbi:proton-conducting transporter transmembrane domain-containing protein [Pedobacter jamesrossensis]|uniref:Proton-conducting transporter membrane subunit n=1 Tax=Pedobacter jamesrossensis TaxID=1908238 RepID=A0ABV8NNQ9_9SPHI
MNLKKESEARLKEPQKSSHNYFITMVTVLFSIVFLATGGLIIFGPAHPDWTFWGLFRIKGFTLLIWGVVSLFSALISGYSSNYLQGFKYQSRFAGLCLGFTLSVMTMVAGDQVVALLISWFSMGFFMSRLIGVELDWPEARAASRYAQRFFIWSSGMLITGVLLLSFSTEKFTLSGIMPALSSLPTTVLFASALFIIIACLIQSAIYPFHRWLLSAMTAPTPASALMHAGFVNGSGILLTIFASLIVHAQVLSLLFVVGSLTALAAQFTKLLQISVKQKLACSTIAQMGFMIMQCGLGFFNAAVTHLILHGFYKAYLFLSSGENIKASVPEKAMPIFIRPFQALVVILSGIIGAALFALLTGKGTMMDSGIFLTLVVAITVGQATYNILKQSVLSLVQKLLLPLLLFPAGIGSYALVYSGVSNIIKDIPFVEVPSPVSMVQLLFGVVFLLGFFIMKLELYKKFPWLYVKLLNLSQPYHKTILTHKNKSI